MSKVVLWTGKDRGVLVDVEKSDGGETGAVAARGVVLPRSRKSLSTTSRK